MTTSLSANSPLSNLDTQTIIQQREPHDSSKIKKDRLKNIHAIDHNSLIDFPKLAIDSAMAHIKNPVADWGHKDINSKRVLTDLGESVFSLLFKSKSVKSINQPPEHDNNFMSLIEEIERYMYEIIAIPNNENELQEDMRKHKKFIQESIDDLEFLEKYFGIVRMPGSAIVNFKKFRPVTLDVDASGDRF